MLEGHQSISAYSKRNLAIWMVMAFQAGILNTGGFMACHTFVSHVTGYATLFGASIKDKDLFQAAGLFTVPLLFLIGAMISGVLVDIRLKLNKKPKYYVIFGVMFVLTLLVFLAGITDLLGAFGEPLMLTRDYILLAILCLICGIQNGAVSTVSRSIVRTTHLTGITTDLGLGLVRIMYKQKLPEDVVELEKKANQMRMGVITFFILGCVFAAFAFRKFEYYGFLIPLAIYGVLFALSFRYQVMRGGNQAS